MKQGVETASRNPNKKRKPINPDHVLHGAYMRVQMDHSREPVASNFPGGNRWIR